MTFNREDFTALGGLVCKFQNQVMGSLSSLSTFKKSSEGFSSEEKAFHTRLKKKHGLPKEYSAFCEQVFNNDSLMKGKASPGLVSRMIYNLYVDNGKVKLKPIPNSWKDYYDYWLSIYKANKNAFLQNYRLTIREVLGRFAMAMSWKKYTGDPTEWEDFRDGVLDDIQTKWESDFIWHSGSASSTTHRVYANLALSSIPTVSKLLQGESGVSGYKFAGPSDFGTRGDAMVCYCESESVAKRIAKKLHVDKNVEIQEGTSGMTTQTTGSTGIGIGAEPEWIATGMEDLNHDYLQELADEASKGNSKAEELLKSYATQTAQSFGSIRSQIISSAIQHFKDNKGLTKKYSISEKELFFRFVALGLEGYDLI